MISGYCDRSSGHECRHTICLCESSHTGTIEHTVLVYRQMCDLASMRRPDSKSRRIRSVPPPSRARYRSLCLVHRFPVDPLPMTRGLTLTPHNSFAGLWVLSSVIVLLCRSLKPPFIVNISGSFISPCAKPERNLYTPIRQNLCNSGQMRPGEDQ